MDAQVRELIVIQDDDLASDSGFGTDTSDTTSITSSMFEGYLENGRRYQTKREGEYWGPSDEKQVCILLTQTRIANEVLCSSRVIVALLTSHL